jgi:hypothetical protein
MTHIESMNWYAMPLKLKGKRLPLRETDHEIMNASLL